MSFLVLDCLKSNTAEGNATVSIKFNCCNKTVKRKISVDDRTKLENLFSLSDSEFNAVINNLINQKHLLEKV